MTLQHTVQDTQEGFAELVALAQMVRKEIDAAEEGSNLTVEELALLLQVDRLETIDQQMQDASTTIRDRQEDIRLLHDAIAKINNALDDKDRLDIADNEELQELFQQLRDELDIDIDPAKTYWKSEEKDRLIEALRFRCEDLNSINQMDLQDIHLFMTKRYEIYELTKSILKPLHQDKVNKARKLSMN